MRLFRILFLCSLLNAGQQPSLANAKALLATGSYDDAARALREIVKTHPGDLEAHVLLGSALAALGLRSESIQQLTQAVRLGPNSAMAYNALGFALSRFAEMKAAQDALERAVQLSPQFAEAHINLALVLAQEGELERATEQLDRAIQAQGRHSEAAYAFYLRGKLSTQMNDYDKAVADLQLATTLQPEFADAWLALGLARRVALDPSGALLAFERAVALAPENSAAQYHLGLEYLQRGRFHQAVAHLKDSLLLNPDDKSTVYNLQRALRQDGQSEEAARLDERMKQLIAKAGSANENSLTAARLDNEGVDLERRGNLRLAIEKYREALELYPNHDGFRLNYGLALCRAGQWDTGIAEIRDIVQRNPDNAEATRALYLALDHARVVH